MKFRIIFFSMFSMFSTALLAQDACKEIYDSLNIVGSLPADYCMSLSVYLSSELTDNNFITSSQNPNLKPRVLQNRNAEPSGAGLLNQSGAVTSVQPIALAGGSFATGGTDDGASTIFALTLNPSIFYTDISNPNETAKSSRLGDITVFFPTNAVEENTSELEYFGIRARLNITGISTGDELLQNVQSIYSRLTIDQNKVALSINKLLNEATDKQACYDQIKNKEESTNSCYSNIEFPVFTQKQKDELESKLREARMKADSKYFGLDLRFDSGDPTLGSKPGAAGTRLFGGLARGRTLEDKKEQTMKYHFRIGVDYFDQEDYQSISTDTVMNMPVMDTTMVLGRTNFSLDSAFGLEFSKSVENQTVSFSTGLELRLARDIPDDMDEVFQTNYMMLRSSLSVPFTSTNKISLNLGVPVFGEISPVFSISANWSLLLPD
ncbi:MAG: hypothetical protein JJ958_06345 [Balneola sp.]|nr:hypothetical protein [Balneola sp.]